MHGQEDAKKKDYPESNSPIFQNRHPDRSKRKDNSGKKSVYTKRSLKQDPEYESGDEKQRHWKCRDVVFKMFASQEEEEMSYTTGEHSGENGNKQKWGWKWKEIIDIEKGSHDDTCNGKSDCD